MAAKKLGVEPQVLRDTCHADLNSRVPAVLGTTEVIIALSARATLRARLHKPKSPLDPLDGPTSTTRRLKIDPTKHLRYATPCTESDVKQPAIADDDSQIRGTSALETPGKGERRHFLLHSPFECADTVNKCGDEGHGYLQVTKPKSHGELEEITRFRWGA